ncbi:hypothetical protein [Salana multivorans]
MRPAKTCAAALAGVALIGGCSSQPSEPTETDTAGDASGLDSSPLQAFYASLYGEAPSPAEQAAEEWATMTRQAELVAECMTAQGFSYEPWFPGMELGPEGLGPEGEDDFRQLEPMERAQQWGYGGFTRAFEEPENPEAYEDPNRAAVEQQSESEQAAYWAALTGGDGDEGCELRASSEVNTLTPRQALADALHTDPRFGELQQAINDIDTAHADSPEVVSANRLWSDCMATAGFDHAAPWEAEVHFMDLLVEDEELTEADADAEAIDAQRSDLAAEEIATAVADQRCRDETEYDETTERVRWHLEREVLDRYADDVAALLALVEQAPEPIIPGRPE